MDEIKIGQFVRIKNDSYVRKVMDIRNGEALTTGADGKTGYIEIDKLESVPASEFLPTLLREISEKCDKTTTGCMFYKRLLEAAEEIERLIAERAAAVEDLRETSDAYRICAACKFLGSNGGCKEPNAGQLCEHDKTSKWQWRGVKDARDGC